MKKTTLILALLIAICHHSIAQKKSFRLQVHAEAASSWNKIKFPAAGGFLRGLYDIGHTSQLTIDAGATFFSYKEYMGDDNRVNSKMIPVLLGYKKNFGKVFILPQAGYGIQAMKVNGGAGDEKLSTGAFYFAIGTGYEYKQLTFGFRFLGYFSDPEETPPYYTPLHTHLHYFGLHVGYTIPFGK